MVSIAQDLRFLSVPGTPGTRSNGAPEDFMYEVSQTFFHIDIVNYEVTL